jgi:hypothetical protein
MSTKISLSNNNFTHVYNECFDDTNTYIHFRNSDKRVSDVTIMMDPSSVAVVFSGLRKNVASLVGKASDTNEEISERVNKQVEKRIARKGAYGNMGTIIYGSVDDPIEDQISRGEEYFKKIRDDSKTKLKSAIEAIDDEESAKAVMDTHMSRNNTIGPIALSKLCRIFSQLNKLDQDNEDKKLLGESVNMLCDFFSRAHSYCEGNEALKGENILDNISSKLSCKFDTLTPNLFDVGDIG